MATFDPSKIAASVKDTEPLPARPGRQPADNPFGPILRESFESGTAKQVTVPNGEQKNKNGEFSNVITVENMIRKAADNEELGVRVLREDHPSGKSTIIKFQAKERTIRQRRSTNDETSTDESTGELEATG